MGRLILGVGMDGMLGMLPQFPVFSQIAQRAFKRKFLHFLLVLDLVLVITGCGSETTYYNPDATNYPWDGLYKTVSRQGILINYPELPSYYPSGVEISSMVSQSWDDMQECTGIYINPDRTFVIDYNNELENGFLGFIYWVDEYAYARVFLQDLLPDVYEQQTATRHEMIHYLLYLDGRDEKQASLHNYPEFNQCE